jgi:glycosyltransferase involved in cell wall biosynthesis
MRVSGATFVRNALRFDYPVTESITSILPLCDEFIVNVGRSEDDTLALIESIDSKKIKVIRSVWNDTKREGGRILSEQTNRALSHCSGDWIFYIQADEVVHERYLDIVRRRMEAFLGDDEVEGLIFDFNHFYGSYFLVKNQRGWYRREIRIIRNNIGVSSWKDAQGFRLNGRKLRVMHSRACVYHYGWSRDPEKMLGKQRNLDRYWHSDSWIKARYEGGLEIKIRGVEPFTSDHPAVMTQRIQGATWDRFKDPHLRRRFKPSVIRRLTSIFDRLGEYRNYVLLDEPGQAPEEG